MLADRRIAILVEQDFDEALMDPVSVLKEAGARLTMVGGDSHRIYRGQRGKAEVRVDAVAAEVSPDYFDAVIIAGGYAPDRMRLSKPTLALVRRMHDLGKLVAAMGHGPQVLISAEIVRGRRVTSWPAVAVDLMNAGALWADEPVVRDGNLITSRHPADTSEFSAAIIGALRELPARGRAPARSGPAGDRET